MASVVLRRCALGKIHTLKLLRNIPKSVKFSRRNISLSHQLLGEKYFTEKHEWVEVNSDIGTVGISDYAQDKLGEVVYVQLPEIDMELELDQEAGVLESVKAASEVYSPVSGIVTEANTALEDNPKLVNDSPYENGWLYKLKIRDSQELSHLMKEEEYTKYIQTIE